MVDRIGAFRAAWRDLAPEATFAGMTLSEFEVAISPPEKLRSEIVAIERQWEGKKAEKLTADAAANELLNLVVNSVRGTPGYGPDCSLYRALGYVRTSERKSGLSRKGGTPIDNANAA